MIDPSGRLESSTLQHLKQELFRLIAQDCRELVLKLGEQCDIDRNSIGTLAAVLVIVYRRLRAVDGFLSIVAPLPSQRRAFQEVRLDRIFRLYTSELEAVGSSGEIGHSL